MNLSEPIQAAVRLVEIFEEIGIPYFLGGSIASSVQGTPRLTNDVDFVAGLVKAHIDPLIRRTEQEFYISKSAVEEAVQNSSSFNLIYQKTVQKIDVFVLKDSPYGKEQMRRRQEAEVAHDPSVKLFLSAAEDTILNKLVWYKKGGEESDRQWRDILGVLKEQAQKIDFPYMQKWAAFLNISDLLKRAASETASV